MVPNPRGWYIHDMADDAPTVTIYDGSDFAVIDIEARAADGEVFMEGFTARELALVILAAVGAEKPIQ